MSLGSDSGQCWPCEGGESGAWMPQAGEGQGGGRLASGSGCLGGHLLCSPLQHLGIAPLSPAASASPRRANRAGAAWPQPARVVWAKGLCAVPLLRVPWQAACLCPAQPPWGQPERVQEPPTSAALPQPLAVAVSPARPAQGAHVHLPGSPLTAWLSLYALVPSLTTV